MADKIQGDPERALADLIAECPMVSDYLRSAKRVTEGEYGRLRVRKDYSYHNTKFWRPGMAVIGDAACFVDPVFSSGVHLATYSALLAARSINSTLAGIVSEELAFREFERRYRREYGTFYEFLVSFYDMNHSASSYFWSAKKITSDNSSELESFVNLVGGVSSGEAALTGGSSVTEHFRSRAKEVSEAVDEFVAIEERDMLPWFKSALIREATVEMEEVQSLAVLGGRMPVGTQMFDHGLVPSPDGMFWRQPSR